MKFDRQIQNEADARAIATAIQRGLEGRCREGQLVLIHEPTRLSDYYLYEVQWQEETDEAPFELSTRISVDHLGHEAWTDYPTTCGHLKK